ncbi:MAG: hypothetical protein RLO18_31070, partial [Gimesia chilikensis]
MAALLFVQEHILQLDPLLIIYLAIHGAILRAAFIRGRALIKDCSFVVVVACGWSLAYPYVTVAADIAAGETYSRSIPGEILAFVSSIAGLSCIITLGNSFAVRPALRCLRTVGPYSVVRHPLYSSYILGDLGLLVNGLSFGAALVVATGWIALVFRLYR